MSIDRFWILVARKLSGESSTEEIRELEALLRTHPHLHFSTEIITNLWNQQVQKDLVLLESSYASHIERLKSLGIPVHAEAARDEGGTTYLLHGSRGGHARRKIVIAACISVIFLAGSFFYIRGTRPEPKVEKKAELAVSTKNGSRTNIQLPDGSKVWLNSGSTLTYDKDFGKSIREVVLSGEAFFDVVKNAEKPFVIHTTSMDIKVLGTQFNVKSYANDHHSEASLIHGSIEVSLKKRGSEKILLKANEKIVVINEAAVVKDALPVQQKNKLSDPIISVQKLNYDEKDSTIIETSWVDNKLYFSNESFEEIAVKMERWYGMPVIFHDSNLKNSRFTGSFTKETIEQALEALQFSTPFHFVIKENTILITK